MKLRIIDQCWWSRNVDEPEVVANESNANTSIRKSSKTCREHEIYIWNKKAVEVLVVDDSNDAPATPNWMSQNHIVAKWLKAMSSKMQSMHDNLI